MSRQGLAWPTLILLLAATLRILALDQRALWFDEGISLTFAHLSLPDVPHYSVLWQDVNPPAYRVFLGIWLRAVGTTALTARSLSGWLGVLGIALVYAIGRQLGLRRASNLAMLLVAIAPMQVYYSREIKGYTFVQAFILLAVVLWLKLFTPKAGRAQRLSLGDRKTLGPIGWSILTSAISLAIGAHYMAGLMLITMNVWVAIRLAATRRHRAPWPQARQPLLVWLEAQAIAIALWLPWVLATATGAAEGTRVASAEVGLEPFNPMTYLSTTLGELASGPVGSTWARAVLSLIVLGLAVLGLIQAEHIRVDGLNTKLLLASWLLGPVLLGLAARVAIPFFYPRFLLYTSPALGLLTALGAKQIGEQRWRVAILAPVIGLSGILLMAQQQQPDPSPDLRPVAAELAERIEAGDALIYSYSWQPGMIRAYLPADKQPVYYASFFDNRDAELEAIMDRHGRAWLLTYQIGADNPINDVGLWLLAHNASPGGSWYGESQLSLFIAASRVHNLGPASSCVSFDGRRIELCFAPLADSTEITGPERNPLTLALHWQAHERLAERLTVFVHVLEPDNPIPIAQQDTQPGNGTQPTNSWAPGQHILDLHAVALPGELAGQNELFTVYVGLYDADTLERLPVDGGGDSVLIGSFRVVDD